MSDSLIILCPGQGAQHVGMGRAWAEKSDAARAVFQTADKTLGFPLSKLCFEGPEDQLTRTDVAQAAIYTTTIACFRALNLDGNLTATAGLSLGEYTALHLAGALSFEDGLTLVRQRGQFMQEAAQSTPSGMVALIGADEDQAQALCNETTSGGGNDVLSPANFNCPGQIVISGSKVACERALAVAQKMGLRATALNVAGAFHSALMQPAADRMAAALNQVAWNKPACTVLSNVTGKPHDPDPAAIKKLLVDQITHPVRWTHDMQWLVAHVKGRYIEPAPGKVLAGLMRRIDKSVKVENFAEPA